MAENSNVTTKEAKLIFSVDRNKLDKLMTGMSLLEIFKNIKEKSMEITMNKSVEDNLETKTSCFICLLKAHHFKELWKKLPADYKTTLTTKMGNKSSNNRDNNEIDISELLLHDFQESSADSIDRRQLFQALSLGKGHLESGNETWESKIKHMFVNVAESLLTFNDDCSDHVDDWVPQASEDTFMFLASTDLSREYVESHEVLSKYCKYSHSEDLQNKVIGFKVCEKCMTSISFVSPQTDDDRPPKAANAVDLLNHVITMLYVCASECDDIEGDDKRDETTLIDNHENDVTELVQKQTESFDGKFVTVQIAADMDEYESASVTSSLLPAVVQQPFEVDLSGGTCAEFVSNGLQHKTIANEKLDFHTSAMVCPSGAENSDMIVEETPANLTGKVASETVPNGSPTTYKRILLRTHHALKALQTDNTLIPNSGSFRWVKSVNVTKVKTEVLNTRSLPSFTTNDAAEDKDQNGKLLSPEPTLKNKVNGFSDITGVTPLEENVPRAAKSKCKEIINLIVNTNELVSDPTLPSSPNKQGKSRTPGKKKSEQGKHGSSMKRIVWGYLTSPTEFGSARSPPPPRNKGRRSQSSKPNSPRKKAIPIPYETHYLCITRTIAKKGWKAYWYRKCRCAKSRRSSTLTESPNCSYSGSPVHTPDEISLTANDLAIDSKDLEVDVKHEPTDAEPSSPSAIEVVITSSTKAVKQHEQPECSNAKPEPDESPLDSTKGFETIEPHKERKFLNTKTESGCTDEPKHSPDGTYVDQVNTTYDNFVSRVARDIKEVENRRAKLKDLLRGLKKLRNLRSQETCDLLLKPVVFAQSHEPVDKQPSSLDLVSVNRSVVASCVDSNLVKLDEIFTKRSAHAASLLEGAGLSAFARSRNAKCEGDPFFGSVWNYGKLPKFFEETRLVKPLKRLKMLKSGFRAAKPNVLGIHRLKSLKRAMLHTKPRQIHIQRVKPSRVETQLVANANFNQKLEPDLWQVPKQSVSAVVGGLEYLWGEVLQNPQPVPMMSSAKETRPYGAVEMCNKQVEYALGALCKDDDIFTFSSKRVNTGKGQKNVLLISRKYLTEPRPRRRRYRKDSLNGECPCMQMKPFTFEAEIETPRVESPNKILLKLKKVHNDDSVVYTAENEKENAVRGDSEPKLIIEETTTEQMQIETQTVEKASVSAELTEHKSLDVALQDDTQSTSTSLLTKAENFDQSQVLSDSAVTEKNDVDVIDAAEQIKMSNQTAPSEESFSRVTHNSESHDRLSSDEWATPPSSPLHLAGNKLQIATPKTFLRNTGLDTSTPHANAPDKQSNKLQSPLPNKISSEPNEDGVYNGELHQFLSKLNENSLDLLESVLLWCDPDQLPPLQLLMSLHDVHNETTEEDRARLLTSVGSPCHFDNFYPENCGLLSFGSPEVIRGITHTKDSPQQLAAVGPMSPNESDADFRGSPVSPGCLGKPNDTSHGAGLLNLQHGGSTLLKACNVVLEPIDSLCKDLENGVGSTKSTATSYHRTLYEKILKNHALNGAYWKSSPSSLPGVPGPARILRDRVKRKRSYSDQKVEEESDEESSEDSDDDTPVSVPSGPKRKRLGNVEYTRVTNQNIEDIDKKLSKIQSTAKLTDVNNKEHTQAEDLERHDFFQLLISPPLDLNQVMCWMLNTTATNPRPLLSPYLVAKRNRLRAAQERPRTKSRSRRASSVVSTTSTVTSCSDDVKGGKRRSLGHVLRKKAKDFLTPSKTGRWKPISDDQFEALRRQLFHARHPDYKGRLYTNGNHAVVTITPKELVVRSTSLQLHHVNEDEARKSATPFLNKRVIVNGNSSTDIAVPSKRRRIFAPCRTPPHDNQPDDVTQFPQSHVENGNLEGEASEWEESPQPMNPPPVIHRKRGRGRGRPRRILSSGAPNLPRGKLFSSSRGRGRGSRGRGSRGRGSSRMAKLVVRGEPEQQSEHERGPRLNSRFANKHSTEGSFLQRILESGNLEKYL